MDYNIEAIKKAKSEIKIIGDESLIPLNENAFIAGYALILDDNFQPAVNFFNYLAQAITNDCSFGFIDNNITDDDLNSFAEDTSESDIIIFALFSGNTTQSILSNNIIKAIEKISEGKKKIFVKFNFTQIENLNNINADLLIETPDDSDSGLIAANLTIAGKGFFETIL